MALTYVTPDGTVVTTLAGLADWAYDHNPGSNTVTPTTATVVVYAHQKPGTAAS